jgi:uncharacterized protein (DUF1330 family)
MSAERAYMLVTCKIDAAQAGAFKQYVGNARPLFAAYGGKPAGQYAVASTLVGSADTTHVIVMEFPSADAIRACLADPAYVALIPFRSLAFPTLHIAIAADFDPMPLIQAGS